MGQYECVCTDHQSYGMMYMFGGADEARVPAPRFACRLIRISWSSMEVSVLSSAPCPGLMLDIYGYVDAIGSKPKPEATEHS